MWSISTGLPPPVKGEPESTRLRQYKPFLASGVQRQPYLNIP
jgi:hypothetical protein